jgi:hypothetical protein
MKDPDEKEDGTGDDQVKFLAHIITPTCCLTPAIPCWQIRRQLTIRLIPFVGRRLKRPVDALVGGFATIYLVLY